MAPAARRPRAALALLLALAALGPAAPASTWAPRNASEAEGRGWTTAPASSDAPEAAHNGTRPGGPPAASAAPRLEPPGATAAPEPAAGAGKAPPPCFGCPGPAAAPWPHGGPEEAGSGEPPPPPAAGSWGATEGPAAPGAPTAGPARDWEPLAAASSATPALGARGRADGARAGSEAAVTAAPGTAEAPGGRGAAEILDADYYELVAGAAGGAATPWGLRELYDDLAPFEEADFYPTTSFYTEGDEEEDEEEEEEEEEAGGLEDENGPPAATPAAAGPEPRPTGRRAATPPPPPAVGPGGPANGTECRGGFVRHNGSCRSLCDLVPSYCHNGGHCYVVEGHGAVCRCNTQAYTWHKGPRCEAVVTDFQVLCVAVGSAALVLLLLFMLTVFFAKKLYLLKTENSKLRKTKYRSPSELHNDNFSLSTIAEGSHPNEEPGGAAKPRGSLQSCGKEEEALGPPGAPSPQRPGPKGEQDGAGANCLPNSLA